METIVRNVRDLAKNDRSTLERVVGQQLRESQQLVIQVITETAEDVSNASVPHGELPDWCNIYAGLADKEIDELDRSITRSDSSRDFS